MPKRMRFRACTRKIRIGNFKIKKRR